MRLLEIMSAALAFASAAIIFSYPTGQDDKSLLHLAGLFCVGIAVYQVVIFYLGLTLQPKRAKDQIEAESHMDRTTNDLPQSHKEIEEREFLELPSITENTTELIKPNPREAPRKQHQ